LFSSLYTNKQTNFPQEATLRVEVREAERSTAQDPRFLWRVWDAGKCLDFGMSPSREEAELEAEAAEEQLERRQAELWWGRV